MGIQEAAGAIFIYTQVLIISFLLEFSILLALPGTFQLASPILKTLGHSGVRKMTEEENPKLEVREGNPAPSTCHVS